MVIPTKLCNLTSNFSPLPPHTLCSIEYRDFPSILKFSVSTRIRLLPLLIHWKHYYLSPPQSLLDCFISIPSPLIHFVEALSTKKQLQSDIHNALLGISKKKGDGFAFSKLERSALQADARNAPPNVSDVQSWASDLITAFCVDFYNICFNETENYIVENDWLFFLPVVFPILFPYLLKSSIDELLGTSTSDSLRSVSVRMLSDSSSESSTASKDGLINRPLSTVKCSEWERPESRGIQERMKSSVEAVALEPQKIKAEATEAAEWTDQTGNSIPFVSEVTPMLPIKSEFNIVQKLLTAESSRTALQRCKGEDAAVDVTRPHIPSVSAAASKHSKKAKGLGSSNILTRHSLSHKMPIEDSFTLASSETKHLSPRARSVSPVSSMSSMVDTSPSRKHHTSVPQKYEKSHNSTVRRTEIHRTKPQKGRKCVKSRRQRVLKAAPFAALESNQLKDIRTIVALIAPIIEGDEFYYILKFGCVSAYRFFSYSKECTDSHLFLKAQGAEAETPASPQNKAPFKFPFTSTLFNNELQPLFKPFDCFINLLLNCGDQQKALTVQQHLVDACIEIVKQYDQLNLFVMEFLIALSNTIDSSKPIILRKLLKLDSTIKKHLYPLFPFLLDFIEEFQELLKSETLELTYFLEVVDATRFWDILKTMRGSQTSKAEILLHYFLLFFSKYERLFAEAPIVNTNSIELFALEQSIDNTAIPEAEVQNFAASATIRNQADDLNKTPNEGVLNYASIVKQWKYVESVLIEMIEKEATNPMRERTSSTKRGSKQDPSPDKHPFGNCCQRTVCLCTVAYYLGVLRLEKLSEEARFILEHSFPFSVLHLLKYYQYNAELVTICFSLLTDAPLPTTSMNSLLLVGMNAILDGKSSLFPIPLSEVSGDLSVFLDSVVMHISTAGLHANWFTTDVFTIVFSITFDWKLHGSHQSWVTEVDKQSRTDIVYSYIWSITEAVCSYLATFNPLVDTSVHPSHSPLEKSPQFANNEGLNGRINPPTKTTHFFFTVVNHWIHIVQRMCEMIGSLQSFALPILSILEYGDLFEKCINHPFLTSISNASELRLEYYEDEFQTVEASLYRYQNILTCFFLYLVASIHSLPPFIGLEVNYLRQIHSLPWNSAISYCTYDPLLASKFLKCFTDVCVGCVSEVTILPHFKTCMLFKPIHLRPLMHYASSGVMQDVLEKMISSTSEVCRPNINGLLSAMSSLIDYNDEQNRIEPTATIPSTLQLIPTSSQIYQFAFKQLPKLWFDLNPSQANVKFVSPLEIQSTTSLWYHLCGIEPLICAHTLIHVLLRYRGDMFDSNTALAPSDISREYIGLCQNPVNLLLSIPSSVIHRLFKLNMLQDCLVLLLFKMERYIQLGPPALDGLSISPFIWNEMMQLQETSMLQLLIEICAEDESQQMENTLCEFIDKLATRKPQCLTNLFKIGFNFAAIPRICRSLSSTDTLLPILVKMLSALLKSLWNSPEESSDAVRALESVHLLEGATTNLHPAIQPFSNTTSADSVESSPLYCAETANSLFLEALKYTAIDIIAAFLNEVIPTMVMLYYTFPSLAAVSSSFLSHRKLLFKEMDDHKNSLKAEESIRQLEIDLRKIIEKDFQFQSEKQTKQMDT